MRQRLIGTNNRMSLPLSIPRLLMALRPFTVLLLIFEVMSGVLAGCALWAYGTSSFSALLNTSLVGVFTLSTLRIVWTLSTGSSQIRAVVAARKGKAAVTGRSSSYTVLATLRWLGWMLIVAELGISIALSVGLERYIGGNDEAGFVVSAVCLSMCWFCALFRLLLARPEPLRWHKLFAADNADAWAAHRHGRVTSLLRQGLCCVCEPHSACFASDPSGTVADGANDLASATAVGLAEFIGGSSPNGLRLSAVGAGLELLHAASIPLSAPPSGRPLTPELMTRCREAAELHRFAIGAYTGVLFELARSPLCGMCCFARRQFRCIGSSSTRDAVVDGDNCLGGHRSAFLSYACEAETEAMLLSGQVGNGPGEVTFFCVHRPTRQQIVIAVRGTEKVSDGLTDALFTPAALTADDLGLRADNITGTVNLGAAFGGVLACSRSLTVAVLPVLKKALESVPDPSLYCIYLCGHSLGASTAALTALRLRGLLHDSGVDVKAACFNPMPCMTPDALKAAAPWAKNAILSIVFRDDFASRLSLQRVLNLRDRALSTGKAAGLTFTQQSMKAVRLFTLMACRCVCKAGVDASATELGGKARSFDIQGTDELRVASDIEEAVDIAENIDEARGALENETYLAGQVLHVRGDPPEIVACSAYDFPEMNVTPNFLLNHVPWGLQHELASILGYSFSSGTAQPVVEEDEALRV